MQWQHQSSVSTLAENHIHIWHIPLQAEEAQIENAAVLLDDEEQCRASRFKFPQHRRRFMMAHAGLRLILARYTQAAADKLRFAKHNHNKPYLADFPQVQFNLTHSEDVALCAITLNTPLGIDVEYHQSSTDMLGVAERFFSPDEFQFLIQLPASQQAQGFFNAWTRKEAFIKAIGDGLHFPLDKFSVSIAVNKPVEIIEIEGDSLLAKCYQLISFTPAVNYTAALAIHRLDNQFEFYQYND
jgi:4'-phosphopantetheinyl transferase